MFEKVSPELSLFFFPRYKRKTGPSTTMGHGQSVKRDFGSMGSTNSNNAKVKGESQHQMQCHISAMYTTTAAQNFHILTRVFRSHPCHIHIYRHGVVRKAKRHRHQRLCTHGQQKDMLNISTPSETSVTLIQPRVNTGTHAVQNHSLQRFCTAVGVACFARWRGRHCCTKSCPLQTA